MIKMPLLLFSKVHWTEPPEFRRDCLDPGARIGWPHHVLFLALVAIFLFVLFPTGDVPGFIVAAIFAAGVAYGQTLTARYQPLPAWLTEERICCMRFICRASVFLQGGIFSMDVGSIQSVRFGKKAYGNKEVFFVELTGKAGGPPFRIGLDGLKTMEKLILCFEENGIPYETARED